MLLQKPRTIGGVATLVAVEIVCDLEQPAVQGGPPDPSIQTEDGALASRLHQIVGIGADEYTMGTKTIGSVLVTGMKLAGS